MDIIREKEPQMNYMESTFEEMFELVHLERKFRQFDSKGRPEVRLPEHKLKLTKHETDLLKLGCPQKYL